MGYLIIMALCFGAGAFVAWNMPQPDWAKKVQAQATQLIGQFTGKSSGNDGSKGPGA